MRTIILTYPGFQSLPRGIKQLLLASENFYFDEMKSVPARVVKPENATIAQVAPVSSLGRILPIYAGT